ncbi:hypothetical protein PR202_ga20523 [Eleusine coracana subsp. coracana]|uniref:Protein kinase domain-containing protein n=1 Tax=Eleusine coracana subsp. coracana TaxID=191504 RepID=A0AAV5CXM2_ELECO|nr:hypothetical protein PR202_ga20523 [Eleusine coracana subsp. coracana]
MGCFSCFSSGHEEGRRDAKGGGNGAAGAGRAAASSSAVGDGGGREEATRVERTPAGSDKSRGKGSAGAKKELSVLKDAAGNTISAQTFTFRQLAAATRNFRDDCFIGEGGFGRVYKGRLDGTGQLRLNADLPPDKEPLDWNTRMKIAAGAAKGLEYLHDKAQPPVIYRDFKSSNILLGEGFHPKLSDFGLAKLGPVGDKSHVSTRVMGTYGYCAPEYAMTGQLTVKSDVYSFGVVLLELITGRQAIDNTRPHAEQNLVSWARPLFNDRRKHPKMADPRLAGQYPMRGLYQALAVASMCIQSEAASRPLIADVVTALSFLASQTYDPNAGNTSKKAGGGDQLSRVVDSGRALSKNDDSGSSGHKSPSKDREDSPRNLDRERMVAEAKMWGENWREKRRAAAGSQGSLDSPTGGS